ncbi:MAG: AAA family ATPase [Candidatus Hodarchaeales archaeon]|jgi:MoxR-like ATPase
METYIGREREKELVRKSYHEKIPVIITGPCGTGKTEFIKWFCRKTKLQVFRVDGTPDLDPVKLIGHFDPYLVINQGFIPESFLPGALMSAMKEGGVFFFNESNRAPASAINAVLSAIDEREIHTQLGTTKARDNFWAVFVCNGDIWLDTTLESLPAAFHDRCCTLEFDYQDFDTECQVVMSRTGIKYPDLVHNSVNIIRKTRGHPLIDWGISVRGAIQLTTLMNLEEVKNLQIWQNNGIRVLSGKIKLKPGVNRSKKAVIMEIVTAVVTGQKKAETSSRREKSEQFLIDMETYDPIQTMSVTALEIKSQQPNLQKLADYSKKAIDFGNISVVNIIAEHFPMVASNTLVRNAGGILFEKFDCDDLVELFFKVKRYLPLDLRKKIFSVVFPKLLKRVRGMYFRSLKASETRYVPYSPGIEWDLYHTMEKMLSRAEKVPSYQSIVSITREKKKVTLVLLIDKSHSVYRYMHQISYVSALLCYAIRHENLNIIAFDNKPRFLKKFNGSESIETILEAILSIDSGGRTDIASALQKASQELENIPRAGNKKICCIISDLETTEGKDPYSHVTKFNDLRIVYVPPLNLINHYYPLRDKIKGLKNVKLFMINEMDPVRLVDRVLN